MAYKQYVTENTMKQAQQQIQSKKEYSKLETREFIGELKGKMLEDSGKRKDGTPWEKYRIIFKQDNEKYPEKEFKNQFTPFNFPKSLKINELENKKFYRILYVTENKKNTKTGKEYKFNKILGVYMHNNSNNNQGGVQSSNKVTPLPVQYTPSTIYKKEIIVLPDEKQVWDNNEFEDETGWLRIAEDSGVFDSEERAKDVFAELTKHIKE